MTPRTAELRVKAAQDGIDIEAALARIGGYEAPHAEPAGIFVKDSREMLRAVRGALERGEAAQLRAAAHKAKGAVGIFGSTSALRLSSDLMAAAARSARREGVCDLRGGAESPGRDVVADRRRRLTRPRGPLSDSSAGRMRALSS